MHAQNSTKKIKHKLENARRVLTNVLPLKNSLLQPLILAINLENAQDSSSKTWPTTNAKLSPAQEAKSSVETVSASMHAQPMNSRMPTTNAQLSLVRLKRNFQSPVFAQPHAQNSTRMLIRMENAHSSPTTNVVKTLHTKKATRNVSKHAQNICSLKVLRRDAKLLNVLLVNCLKLMEHALLLAQTIQQNLKMVPDVKTMSVKVLLSSLKKMVLALLPAQITKLHLKMEGNV
jgi:hypothetical protein